MTDRAPATRMPRSSRRDGSPAAPGGPAIIGRSLPIRNLLRQIARVAPTEATVLVLGERGTGKELVAGAIQQASRRHDRAFVAVNCAALPSELLASELFGHERGAFTGAAERSLGLVRAAEGGTLFLDEVGDLPLTAQAMLLRFLQEREVRPVGSTRAVRVDVRIVAATNKNLEAAIERGAFRADLLDRLREFVIMVPPLRDRREDIPLLVDHFLKLQSQRHGCRAPRVSPEAVRALHAHAWPGNVRELEQTISQAVILADGVIRESDLGLRSGAEAVEAFESREKRGHGPADGQDAGALGGLTPRQRAELTLAEQQDGLRRGDVVRSFNISREAARRDLSALVAQGLLRRVGAGRGAAYRPSTSAAPMMAASRTGT